MNAEIPPSRFAQRTGTSEPPSPLSRLKESLNKSDGPVAQALFIAPFAALWIGVPAWVLYKLLKSKRKPQGVNWPLLVSIGLPAGYFFGSAYVKRQADKAREDEHKRKLKAEGE